MEFPCDEVMLSKIQPISENPDFRAATNCTFKLTVNYTFTNVRGSLTHSAVLEMKPVNVERFPITPIIELD